MESGNQNRTGSAIIPGRESSARILIVEDEPISATILQRHLKDMGHTLIGPISRGEKAIEVALSERPDLILMDIMLAGDIDGVEAAEQIRISIDTPIVFLTARSDSETFERAKITDPSGFLLKPFQSRELYNTVEIALYKSRLIQKEKEQERWLSTTLQSLTEGVITCDSDGCIKYMNFVAESLLEWNLTEALGKKLTEVFQYTQANDEEDFAFDPLADPVENVFREIVLTTRSNRRLFIELNMATIAGERGGIQGTVIVFRDITEKRKSEELLRLLASGVHYAQDAIMITDASTTDPRIVFVNPGFTKLTGYSVKDVINKSPDILNGTHTNQTVLKRLRNSRENGQTFGGEMINYRKDGREFHSEWTVTPIHNQNKHITNFVTIQRDITDRKKDQERLARRYIYEAGLSAFSRSLLDMSTELGVLDNAFRQLLVFFDLSGIMLFEHSEAEGYRSVSYAFRTEFNVASEREFENIYSEVLHDWHTDLLQGEQK
ncbi:MAG: PAS domain S-box protein, partial [Leptospiraceae bacterium]|nr:PAS domain S-box protein [Leptospiraceae bacterium]